ncbi:fibroblast growth factor receptor-like [Halichondria panicea]|uniref:fibroblast growth factor receptor-like n=1 Tax=Halichondria panicea TaxID=6063 RepID=UPI00312BBDD2
MYAQGYFRQSQTEGVQLPYKWLAVESLKLNDVIFNEKTDVSSGCMYIYGVTVWEVFSSGRTPYPGVDPMSMVALLREGKNCLLNRSNGLADDQLLVQGL